MRAIPLIAALVTVAAGCTTRSGPPPSHPPAPSASLDAPSISAVVSSPSDSPIAAVAVSRQRWEFAAHPGQVIVTPHYRFFTTLGHEHVLERLPSFMEAALVRYTTALAELPMPGQRLESYLFHDRRQWTAKTRQLLPDHASVLDNLGRGGFTTRGICVLYYIDIGGRYHDTLAIAAHEGWHQYTQATFRQPLPIWLEEGIATYMEGFRWRDDGLEFIPSRNWERRRALHEAIRDDRLIPMDELVSRSPQSFLAEGKGRLLTYYAQVWALARFLAEGADGRYRPALEQLLVDAAGGSLARRLMESPSRFTADGTSSRVSHIGLQVLNVYFDADIDALEEQYLAYARGLARGGPNRGPQRGGSAIN